MPDGSASLRRIAYRPTILVVMFSGGRCSPLSCIDLSGCLDYVSQSFEHFLSKHLWWRIGCKVFSLRVLININDVLIF